MPPFITLVAERPVAGGLTLGRHDGKVVLVSGAIPGERIRIRVDRTTKQVTFGHVEEVLEASPWRRVPAFDPACGGRAYAHIAYDHQLLLKAQVLADTFQRLGKLTLDGPVDVMASPEVGYRLRARLHVRHRQIGFFREGTHHLCDAGPTGQLSGTALEAARALMTWLGPQADACDAVTLSENVSGTERAAHLERPNGQPFTTSDRAVLPDGITGVSAMQKDGLRTLVGQAEVRDSAVALCGSGVDLPMTVGWRRHAASFFQGNRYLTGRLLMYVLEQATGTRIIDLYSGVGLFAVALAARGASVLAVEGDVTSGTDLMANAEPWASRLEVSLTSVEETLAIVAPDSADVVVLDPPRVGMSPAAIAALVSLAAPRIVYVSCDPATLARDTRQLVAAGYGLSAIQAFDMFPNTPHIETVCVFDRQRS